MRSSQTSGHRFACVALLIAGLLTGSIVAGEAPPAGGPDLSTHEGDVVLLDFWASWCAPCRESFPWMERMIERYGDRGLTVVAVNLDEDRADADAFLEGAGEGFDHRFDPEGRWAEAYALDTMPSSILFDRDGKVAARHEGFRDADTADYEAEIVELLEGRALPAPKRGTDKARKHGPRPWEKGALATDRMRLDRDALDLAWDDHIYFSKEATSGGRSFAGGGCGCN
ncbi:MAG: DUF4266 domain-containing protein [Planctomycetota bacterium]|nr:DUF4266 domain-containing protein [Planctomycetota bacterium]